MIGTVEVFQPLSGQCAVWDDERRVIPCAQSGRTPIDVDHLSLAAVFQLDPFAEPKRMLDAQGDARKEITQGPLHSESDDRSDRTGGHIQAGD